MQHHEFMDALPRKSGSSIERRNAFANEIAARFGHEEFKKAYADCHAATADSVGIARHGYEAAFMRQRLATLTQSI